ncbi:hypothetical protein [Bacillus altitudinis]|nr:hypothetical protein [Bacillus altitudinis]
MKSRKKSRDKRQGLERVGEVLLDDIKWELKLKNSDFFYFKEIKFETK